MKKITTTYICDICGKEYTESEMFLSLSLPMYRRHIQDMSKVPYSIEESKLDVCKKNCLPKLIKVYCYDDGYYSKYVISNDVPDFNSVKQLRGVADKEFNR